MNKSVTKKGLDPLRMARVQPRTLKHPGVAAQLSNGRSWDEPDFRLFKEAEFMDAVPFYHPQP